MAPGDLCDFEEGSARFRQSLKMKSFVEALSEVEEETGHKCSAVHKPQFKKDQARTKEHEEKSSPVGNFFLMKTIFSSSMVICVLLTVAGVLVYIYIYIFVTSRCSPLFIFLPLFSL